MNKAAAFIIIAVLALSSGCAVSNKIYTASGTEGHNINCSGPYANWSFCYEKAGEICGTKGYNVIDIIDDHGSKMNGNRNGVVVGDGSVQVSSKTEVSGSKSLLCRNIIIECKK